MLEQWRCALTSGLTIGIALLLVACGRSDTVQSPSASQAPMATQVADASALPDALSATETISSTPLPRVVVTKDLSNVALQPTQTAPDAPATRTRPPPGFADAALPSRTPLPPPSGTCIGGCDVPPQGCLIKGTLPRADYKVFLLPGQSGYDAAQIDTQKGERWFCTIAEARAAGWMSSKVPLPAHAPAP